MAASRVQRNVDFGQPLLGVVETAKDDVDMADAVANWSGLEFHTPYETTEKADVRTVENDVVAALPVTRFPGVYELRNSEQPDDSAIDAFVVNYDHAEDDPAELTDDDRARLVVNDRLTFVESVASLKKEMYADELRFELLSVLLWLFLAILLLEVWMTRRLVLRGHSDTDAPSGKSDQPANGGLFSAS